MSNNKLVITVDRDDYTVDLIGHLELNGFSGYGEGGFNNSDVFKFCSQIHELSRDMEGTAELLGAQCKSDGSEYLERLVLRCYVLCKSKLNGIIGIHITLSEYPYTDCRKEEILKVSGELQVRNHILSEFSTELKSLVQGDLDTITLKGI